MIRVCRRAQTGKRLMHTLVRQTHKPQPRTQHTTLRPIPSVRTTSPRRSRLWHFPYEADMVQPQQTNYLTATSRPVRQRSWCIPHTVVTAAAMPPAPIPPMPQPRVFEPKDRSTRPNDFILDDANGMLPPFKMDFHDLLDPPHLITKWWGCSVFADGV